MKQILEKAAAAARDDRSSLPLLAACIDHTTLGAEDSAATVERFVGKALELAVRPASVCVYPSLVEAAGVALGESQVGITAVCGAFPSAQTYIEVKLLEVAMAIENGADEIDIPIRLGWVLDGDFERAGAEIAIIRSEIDEDARLKVILETGALVDVDTIYSAAMCAMRAGADFIKTSTGKIATGATPTAVAMICRAVADYYQETGREVGVKVSGGVKTPADGLLYLNIVRLMLPKQWLSPALFRVGSSTLAYAIANHEI